MSSRALAAVMVVCTITAVSAEIGPLVDVATRTRGAARVVIARIADVQARFDTNQFGDQLIVSTAVLEVIETLKGTPASTLRVAIEGGTVGDLTLKVSDLPSVRAGERAVFFLDDGPGGAQTPHQRGRGILKLSPTDRIEGSTVTLDSVRQQIEAAQVRR
jgi:hypothetical protein